jgi:hypothetical protein
MTCDTVDAGFIGPSTTGQTIIGLDLRSGVSTQLAAVVASYDAATNRAYGRFLACYNDCVTGATGFDIPLSPSAPTSANPVPVGRVSALWSANGTPAAAVAFTTSSSAPARSVLRIVGCPDARCAQPANTKDVPLNSFGPDVSMALGSDGVPIAFLRLSNKAVWLLR